MAEYQIIAADIYYEREVGLLFYSTQFKLVLTFCDL